jgi:sugar-specific transcriptional regulator TrmB|tara:strand:- start:27 stop:365 length:339 start_codon:yes stop_codon:yes gene_type:complete
VSEQKQPRRRRSKRLNISKKSQWEAILKGTTKDEIPIQILESISVNLKDGTSVNIYVKELLDAGDDPQVLEFEIQQRLDDMDDIIQDVDFFISVPQLSKAIQPVTDEILKNL